MRRLYRIAKMIIPHPVKVFILRVIWFVMRRVPLFIPPERRYNLPSYQLTTREDQTNDSHVLEIAVHAGGGLGDMVVYTALIDKIQALASCTIDFFAGNDCTKYTAVLYANRANIKTYPPNKKFKNYDLEIFLDHYIQLSSYNADYFERTSPALYAVLRKIETYNSEHLPSMNNTNQVESNACTLFYTERKGLNRYTQLSNDGAFDMSEQRVSIFTDMYRYTYLNEVGLNDVQYITINRGADWHNGGSKQTKLWPRDRYERFIALFKKKYPKTHVVQVKTDSEDALAGVDNIINDAKLEDIIIILKNSLAHVSSEGGLAHVASNLSTPCVVVFGPTPEFYYGYARNINIVSSTCHWCMSATQNWYTKCMKGFEIPPCMADITEEMVLEGVDKIFAAQKPYRYTVESVSLYTSETLKKYAPVIQDIMNKNNMTDSERNGHIFGPIRTYIHSSKRWEYPYIIEQINKEGVGLKIADVGSGRGALSLYLAKLGHDVTAYDMDFNWDNLGYSMMHNEFLMYCSENGVKTGIATGFNIPNDDNSFDVVISTSVIEHVIYKEYMLNEMLRVLAPGGILIITYDLTPVSRSLADGGRAEITSPSQLRELLSGIGIEATLYSDIDIDSSLSDIRADYIAETMADGITVGGMVIRKMK